MYRNVLEPNVIHYSHWADQPTVLIACGGEADTWIVNRTLDFPVPERHGYTFRTKYVTCPNCIDYLIDFWHDHTTSNLELYEFLGWTEEEYNLFVEKNIIPNHDPCVVK